MVTSPANPRGLAGTVDVTVVTTGGTSATSAADQFTYVPTPTVTGINPFVGTSGGRDDGDDPGAGLANATAVYFGATPATIISDSDALLVVTSPAGVAGTVDVTVVTVGGTSATSAADQFTYIPAPAVTILNPSAGPLVGGTTVTITGVDFTGATMVSLRDRGGDQLRRQLGHDASRPWPRRAQARWT